MSLIIHNFLTILAVIGILAFLGSALLLVAVYECHRHERQRREDDGEL